MALLLFVVFAKFEKDWRKYHPIPPTLERILKWESSPTNPQLLIFLFHSVLSVLIFSPYIFDLFSCQKFNIFLLSYQVMCLANILLFF